MFWAQVWGGQVKQASLFKAEDKDGNKHTSLQKGVWGKVFQHHRYSGSAYISYLVHFRSLLDFSSWFCFFLHHYLFSNPAPHSLCALPLRLLHPLLSLPFSIVSERLFRRWAHCSPVLFIAHSLLCLHNTYSLHLHMHSISLNASQRKTCMLPPLVCYANITSCMPHICTCAAPASRGQEMPIHGNPTVNESFHQRCSYFLNFIILSVSTILD